MADFDAGSIGGRLELDTDPFVRGLREAKLQAAAFEREQITKRVGTSGGLSDASAEVRVDDAAARASLAVDEAALERLDHKTANPKVRVDRSQASAALSALSGQVDKLAGAYSRNSAGPLGGTASGHGLAFLIGLAASLAPALGPAIPAVALFGSAAAAAFGGAAISLALYGKVAAGVFKQIQEANKVGKTLTGPLGQLQAGLKGVSTAWDTLQKKAGPGIAKTFVPVFTTLEKVIPKLLPLINGISKGLQGAFTPLQHVLEGGQFERFVKLLTSNAVQDLPQLGQILASGFRGLMGIFTALNPIIQRGLPIIVGWTKEFSKWARFKAPAFVDEVFSKVSQEGPPLLHMLGAVLGGIVGFAKGFGPLVGPATAFLTTLGNVLGGIDLAPLAKGVGDVLTALQPFLKTIEALVNVLLPPLGRLLSNLADNLLGPLGHSLTSILVPAFSDLGDILDSIEPFLGAFITSIADLVNPTGVGLLATLLHDLKGPIQDLVDPLSKVVLYLEGAVDAFLSAVGPGVIDAFARGLGDITSTLSGFVNILSEIPGLHGSGHTLQLIAGGVIAIGLALKFNPQLAAFVAAVTLLGKLPPGLSRVLLGIGSGVAAIVYAAKGYAAVKELVLALKASETLFLGNAVLKLTAFAVGIKGIITAIKEWTVVQWILNAAMDANPIGAVILLVAALAATAYLIYKNWGPIADFFGKMWSKIQGFFSDAVHWLEKAGKDVLHGLLVGIKWVWDHSIYGFLFNRRDAILGAFVGAGEWLLGTGKAILHGLKDGLVWVWDHTLVGFLLNRKDAILGAFSGAIGWLWGVGQDIVRGLIRGIGSLKDDVTNALLNLIPGPLKKFANKLGISSPSKVFHQFGTYVVQGLINGISGGRGRVSDSITGLADVLTNGFKPRPSLALAGAGGGASDLLALKDALVAEFRRQTDALVASNNGRHDELVSAFEKAETKSAARVIETIRKG